MTPIGKWKLGLYVALIFAAGAGSGALVSWQISRKTPIPPTPTPEIAIRLKDRLHDRLQLTPDQMAKIAPMIDEAMRRLETVRRETATQIFSNVSTMHEQVVQVLTPEQRAKFEELEAERKSYLRTKYGVSTNTP
jgi:Spy/CpxP family protein refolding chaperone